MLTEMVRLSYQHRAFYCYVILSIWIFLLVAGMYKYIGNNENSSVQSKPLSSDVPVREFARHFKPDIKNKRIFKLCNPPEDIRSGAEGKIDGNFTLEGVIIFIRHGDRGPLSHIRNISTVNCAGDFSTDPRLESIYQNYHNFILNSTAYPQSAWSQFLGPFHGFPMLPSNVRECKIGELTTLGIGQLLKTGLILRNAYYNKLNLSNSTLSSRDVIVYSTRYRRTVQSAIALLYSFLLENEVFQNFGKITMRESSSLTFCNTDCACPTAEKFVKQYSKETNDRLKSHPAVIELIKQASNIVFEMPDQAQTKHPDTLKDALLTYICHGSSLPCVNYDSQRICVKTDQVTGLFAYIEWESRLNIKSLSRRKYGLLRAYGLLRNVVSHMVQMISESKPKIVLFSGHDKTLEYLTSALGIVVDHAISPHYASRFVIEICRANSKNENHVANDFYFRVIVNGKDVTQTITFCKNSNYYSASYGDKNDEGDFLKREYKLCPIEAIIRQLHDDYFLPFNATNFKDACLNQ
ncbi:2-phosphoxylose phosphatase 1 [Microplitis demolitor]|uniref:2-phosphoxylose phosphatase 1 n=1 Tax=Microplitis demolitor TaxID=69319 RepID=UPI0004CD8998|nr:2-phosphoxylose phosphatase 1 [Microplitis demolitor]